MRSSLFFCVRHYMIFFFFCSFYLKKINDNSYIDVRYSNV